MKIIVLDGYRLNPGDLSWQGFEEMGELTVYDRTPLDDQEEILRRIGDAEIVLTTDNVNFTYRSSGPFPRLAPGNVEIGGTGWSRLAIERRCRYL